jgi:hypothetical protein
MVSNYTYNWLHRLPPIDENQASHVLHAYASSTLLTLHTPRLDAVYNAR